MKKIKTNVSINSILGDNANFKGIFSTDGPFRIDGNFKGKINSTGKVIIGKSGKAECILIAKVIIVGGTVKGDIIAEDKVIVLKTGEIIGNIYSTSVNMDDGVIFNGSCKIYTKEEIKEFINIKKKESYEFN